MVNIQKGEEPAKVDDLISMVMQSGASVVICAEQAEVKAAIARRRLEEGGESIDLDNLYYVLITPNILAGVLFTGLFFFVTFLGMGCMNQIEGQTIFFAKQPPIGREA